MAKKDELIAFSGHLQAVVIGLSKRLEKRSVSIADAISRLAQSGSETALDQISYILAAATGVLHAWVRYNDVRFHSDIRKGEYTYVDEMMTTEHFPINGTGQAEVAFGYLEYDHEPTPREVLNDIKTDNSIRRPDRAETECFLDTHQGEKDRGTIVGLSGSIVGPRGCPHIPCIIDDNDSGRTLRFWPLASQLSQRNRFLVVRLPDNKASKTA